MSVSHLPAHLGQNLAQRIDDQTSVIYIGNAPIGSVTSDAIWSIKRLSIAGGAITIEWADGNTLNDNVWDSRNSLSYS
jgi:hypothetical protein